MKDLEEANKEHCNNYFGTYGPDYNEILPHFKSGAKWQEEKYKEKLEALIQKWEKEVSNNAISSTLKNMYISDLKELKEGIAEDEIV